MGPRDLLESYLLEVLARAQAAQERCSLLLSQDFVSDAPKDLARTISNICNFLANAGLVIFSQIDWDDSEQVLQDSRLLRNTDILIQQLAAHLRYVQGARADRLPWGIIPSLDKLVKQLGLDIQVMLRPKWNYNYSLVLSDLREAYSVALEEYADYLPSVDIHSEVLLHLERPFHVIAFPSLERENILLHTLLGHEIGHLFVRQFLTEERKNSFKQSVIAQVEDITVQEMQRDGISEAKAGSLFWPQLKKGWIAQNTVLAVKYWARALEEILSDIVGAILFGPAALFSTLEMAMQQGYDIPPSPDNNFYPPWRIRLKEVLRIVDDDERFFPVDSAIFRTTDALQRAGRVNGVFENIQHICAQAENSFNISAQPIARVAYARVDQSLRDGVKFLLDDCGLGKKKLRATPARLFKNVAILLERLDNYIPPSAIERNVNDRTSVELPEIINAAWLHRVSSSYSSIITKDQRLDESLPKIRRLANRLTLKAIEFANLSDDYWRSTKQSSYSSKNKKESKKTVQSIQQEEEAYGVLSSDMLVEWMERKNIKERLIITPLLNPKESIGIGSIDLRLGNQFIVMKREAFPLLDIGQSDEALEADIERYQERVIKPYGDKFILHPRQLVIGSSLEYIQIPEGLMSYVIGKSTWGRMGLIIATATKVDPGFRGCITLEIVNEGEIPLVLYPGVPIAQLVLHSTSGHHEGYRGSYNCAIGPEFPKFGGKKASWDYWTRPVRRNKGRRTPS